MLARQGLQHRENRFGNGKRRRAPETDKSARQAHHRPGRTHELEQLGFCRGKRFRQRHGGGKAIGQRVQDGIALETLGKKFRFTRADKQQRYDLADQVGGRPQFESRAPRLRVMTHQHAPEILPIRKSDRQTRRGIHVAHVFAVDGRGTTQSAVGEVERRAIIQSWIGTKWHRCVTRIDDHANALTQV